MIREIARREIVTRGRTRAYKAITGFLLLIAIAAPVVSTLLPDGGSDTRVVAVGTTPDFSPGPLFKQGANVVGLRMDPVLSFGFETLASGEADTIAEALTSGDFDVVIEEGGGLVFEQSSDIQAEFALRTVLDSELERAKAVELGLNPEDLVELGLARTPDSRLLQQGGLESDEREAVQVGMAFIGLFISFLLPQVFGQLTMMSVVEEKSTRVVEVLLGHVRPRTLLTGKLVGVCTLAIVQVAIISAGFLAALLLTSSVSIPSAAWIFLPILVASLVGGLVGYTTLFALLGSLISRQEDASQVMMPAFIPLTAGYIVGQTAAFGAPDTLLARILSFVPLTSPMLLPVRVARDAIEPWEIALSLVLMALGAWLLLRLTAKVYELTILHTGSRIGFKDLRSRLRSTS